MKKIGVFTSGGDAPGMNACIRAVVRSALKRGLEVAGIYRGYQGLIEGDIKNMDSHAVSSIINLGYFANSYCMVSTDKCSGIM